MALAKKIEMVSNFGDTVVFNNAYYKIDSIGGNKNNLFFTISLFKEKNGLYINDKQYKFIPNLESDDNFIKQAYLYLKTLPEYADAIDC